MLVTWYARCLRQKITSKILTQFHLETHSQDLLDSLKSLRDVQEESFVEAFLQFIVNSAELEITVTVNTFLAAVINRSGPEPDGFLPYRDAKIGQAIEEFLPIFIAEFKPFRIPKWCEKVLELLKALIAAGDHLTNCGIYFGTYFVDPTPLWFQYNHPNLHSLDVSFVEL